MSRGTMRQEATWTLKWVEIDSAVMDALWRCNEDPNKESRVIPHPDVGRAVPRTEASLTLKMAKKNPKDKRSKKSLDGLYEVLAPGSSVIKSNAYTSIKKEPWKREVTIRNSALAKFGTKAERQTDLRNYADRKPEVPTGKITEDLINQHAKEARRKLEGNKTIKHKRIADDMSAVSSIHSSVSRALRGACRRNRRKQLSPHRRSHLQKRWSIWHRQWSGHRHRP